MLRKTRYEAVISAMFILVLSRASRAGRRPSFEYTPTARRVYGAMASNHAFAVIVVSRSTSVASAPVGEIS